jgi:PPM family protein phosphatase
MGGHNAGDRASKLAVETVDKKVDEFFKKTWKCEYDIRTPSTCLEALQYATLIADQRILQESRKDRSKDGMGTTLVAAIVQSGRGYYVSVGDSRLYHLVDNDLIQITKDQTGAQFILDGSISPLQAKRINPHTLMYALGGRSELVLENIQTGSFRTERGKLLLCSDGLHGVVPNDGIKELMDSPAPPAEIVQDLINAAIITYGSHDNVTAIVAETAQIT